MPNSGRASCSIPDPQPDDRRPAGPRRVEHARAVEHAVAINREGSTDLEEIRGAIPALNTLAVPPFTRESGTAAVTYLYFGPGTGPGRQLALAERIQSAPRPGLPGASPASPARGRAREAQSRLISDRLALVELCRRCSPCARSRCTIGPFWLPW